jgi:hypothetical protein
MRDDHAAFIPGDILFNGYRRSRAQRAIDSVRPFPVVRVAIMRIQNRFIVMDVIELPGQQTREQKGDASFCKQSC